MIAHAFYRRGIIETWGRGTLKIARLMRDRGLEPPIVTVNEGAVVLTFPFPTLEKTPDETLEKTETPVKTREKTDEGIIRLLRERQELTIAELAEQLKKSDSAIERAVRRLRLTGRLVRIGPDKGGHWKVLD